MTFDPEAVRKRIELNRLIRSSSIGDSAWVDCPRHGRTAIDPDDDGCIECHGDWLRGLRGVRA